MSTTDRFELVVRGEPVPLERARRGRNNWYLPASSRAFRELVQDEWIVAGRPSVGTALFSLSAQFYRASSRPADIDNLAKAILDALTGLAWVDDRQCACLAGVHRFRCEHGDERTVLAVWAIANEERVA